MEMNEEGMVEQAMPPPAEQPMPAPEQPMPEQEQSAGPEFIVAEIEDDLPLLKQIETELIRAIPTVYHAEVDRHVIKGMKVMFDERTSKLVRKVIDDLQQSPSEAVAMGIAGLVSIIKNETKGPMRTETLIPAALILMCQALDFLAKGNKIELTEELVAETTQKLLAYLMQKLGITPEKVAAIKGALAQAQQQGEGGEMPPEGMPPEQGIVNQQTAPPPAPGGGGLIQQQQQGVV
jgi:hypothetical protein